MYRRARARVYKCDICGEKVTLLPKDRGFGLITYQLPNGWVGSYRKNGACLCTRCADAYKTALEEVE